MQSLNEAAKALEAGRTGRALVEECLSRIADPAGEGSRVFLKVYSEQAVAAADMHDRARREGRAPSRFAGIPISIKDLFDVAGDVTTAGSIALRDAAPAARDAVAIARLKAAGFVLIGRSNMTEFAFSGIGINPHYGTPSNAYDRANRRIPGGSSSGAAVSVTDAMAYGGIGTDTGGSCRIPAALCGIVGFKPTARRVPLDGALPLSTTLDSIGPLAATVADCAVLDAVMAGEPSFDLPSVPLNGLRIGVPQTIMLDGVEPAVAATFARTLQAISSAGAHVSEIPLRELTELAQINAKGGFSPPEAYAFHRELIAKKRDMYDPRVLARIIRGAEQQASDYIDLIYARADFIRRVDAVTAGYDALATPTVPIVAPPIADLASDDSYWRINSLVLRNPSIVNFIDRCAISIPCHRGGEAPVGLMLIGAHGADRRLLAMAAPIEKVLSQSR